MTSAEFEAAFRTNQDAVYRFARRMTGSPAAAEGIAQDVFLTLLSRPGCFDAGRGPLRLFLLRRLTMSPEWAKQFLGEAHFQVRR